MCLDKKSLTTVLRYCEIYNGISIHFKYVKVCLFLFHTLLLTWWGFFNKVSLKKYLNLNVHIKMYISLNDAKMYLYMHHVKINIINKSYWKKNILHFFKNLTHHINL